MFLIYYQLFICPKEGGGSFLFLTVLRFSFNLGYP